MEVFICFSWENTIGIREISRGSWDFKGNGWDLMEHHETSLLSDVFLYVFFLILMDVSVCYINVYSSKCETQFMINGKIIELSGIIMG